MDREKAARLLDMLRMRTEERGATPAEAAQAADLASKIIDRYGLDEATCGNAGKSESAVECGQKAYSDWINTLASAICQRFELTAKVVTRTGRNAIVRFVGPEHRVRVALWLFRAIEKDMRRMAAAECSRRDLSGGKMVRFRNQYFDSFSLTIWSRLDPRTPEQIEAAHKELRERLEKLPKPIRPCNIKHYSHMNELDWEASRAGDAAAESIELGTDVLPGSTAREPLLIGACSA
jgi:hypothetical protein